MSIPKILIIDDNQVIREVLQTIVESEFDVDIIEAESGTEAVKKLESDSFDIIFSDYHMPNGNGDVVYQYNKANNKIPFFLITASEFNDLEGVEGMSDANQSFYIPKPIDNELLFEKLNLVISGDQVEQSQDYRRIRIDLLLKYFKVNSDIFIRLSKEKFVKIINAGELDEIGQLDKYIKRGERFAYLMQGDFERSTKALMNSLSEKAKSVSSAKSALAISAISVDVIGSGIKELGVNEEEVELINSCVDACVKNMKSDKKIKGLLDGFFKEKGYLVSHSMTAIHISFMIAKRMEYSSDMILNKLTYAALLHDVVLSDSKLSAVFDKNSSEWDELDSTDQAIINKHPNDSMKLLDSIDDLPNDISNLIQEHHERPDGSGFPRGLSASRIAPISCIFILALKVADKMFYGPLKDDVKKDLIVDLEGNWNKGNFRQPLKALIQILSK